MHMPRALIFLLPYHSLNWWAYKIKGYFNSTFEEKLDVLVEQLWVEKQPPPVKLKTKQMLKKGQKVYRAHTGGYF